MIATRLALLSIHQRDAAIDDREAFAALLERRGPTSELVLATCHRCEILTVVPHGADAHSALASQLGAKLPSGSVVRTDREAALHIFRLACGLDSEIVGERQILGQLRRAFEAARAAGPLAPALALLARRALELGRSVRRETALGQVERTVGSLAVDAALADGSSETRVLVIGAGEIGKLAARALASRVGTLLIANRDPLRAAAVARETDGTAVALERLADVLGDVDVVIAAADTRGAVLNATLLRPRLARGPLTIVDIAMPRSVGPDARALPGLRYLAVDDLRERPGARVDARVVADVEARCVAAAVRLEQELRERDAADTIRALRERGDAIRKERLARALTKLAHLSERDRRVVESLTEQIAGALLHDPTVGLREDPEREEAVRALFALGERS